MLSLLGFSGMMTVAMLLSLFANEEEEEEDLEGIDGSERDDLIKQDVAASIAFLLQLLLLLLLLPPDLLIYNNKFCGDRRSRDCGGRKLWKYQLGPGFISTIQIEFQTAVATADSKRSIYRVYL